jgi:cell division protein FtsL
MTTQSPPLRPVLGADVRAPRQRVQRSSRMRPWFLFVIIVVGAFFGLTYSRISLDRSAFLLDTLEDRIAEEEARHFDLRVGVAELRDPQRIAALATEMGMVFPESRIELAVDRVPDEELDLEYRWAQLRALLSAQP